MKSIYLDHAAATPILPSALAAMQNAYSDGFANTSAAHQWAQRAEHLLTESRTKAARLLGCSPKEILFTASGTESDNLAIQGAAFHARRTRGANHILIGGAEHPAVAETARALGKHFGFEVETIPVDRHGICSIENIEPLLLSTTALVSVIFANNEVGTISPVVPIAELCRSRGVAFHTDAVQAAPWLPLDEVVSSANLLSIGGQKLGGPGLGILVVREGTHIAPITFGGQQEFSLRAGTPHVPTIVGLVEALRHCIEEREKRFDHVRKLQQKIIETALKTVPDIELLGSAVLRTPNHVAFRVAGVEGNALSRILDLRGYSCSTGAACKTGNPAPSSVLLALGFDEKEAREGIRITVGVQNTMDEIDTFLNDFPHIISDARKRALSARTTKS